MRMDKYGRELDLILLLTDNNNYTAQQLADRLGITRRNLYYYFEYLRDSGFHLIKHGTCYRLDRQSPFFRRLHENIALSDSEALFLHRLLDSTERTDHQAQAIRAKLERQFNLEGIVSPAMQRQIGRNVRRLKDAMAQKCMVTLKGYSSPHSHTVADRIVEPFLLMNGGLDVRCYEVRSHENKTFKLARMAEVELMDVPWIHEELHKEVYTDIFMFSGEDRHRVELRLGQLSRNLMLEEYPASADFLSPDGNSHWLLRLDVVSYLGISRFVLGLYEDIDVLGDDDFLRHMRQRVEGIK